MPVGSGPRVFSACPGDPAGTDCQPVPLRPGGVDSVPPGHASQSPRRGVPDGCRRVHPHSRFLGRLRSPRAGASNDREQTPRYGLELAIGVAFLVGAWVLAHQAPKPKHDDQPSRITKAANGSGLFAVFVVGIAMYTPSPTYLAALEVVGSSKLSTAATSLWIILVVLLLLITIEVPILLVLAGPGLDRPEAVCRQ